MTEQLELFPGSPVETIFGKTHFTFEELDAEAAEVYKFEVHRASLGDGVFSKPPVWVPKAVVSSFGTPTMAADALVLAMDMDKDHAVDIDSGLIRTVVTWHHNTLSGRTLLCTVVII